MSQPLVVQVPDHEKLTVYHRALDAGAALETVAAALPGSRGDLRLQLRRASASVVLNIAEGAGEFSGPEKARFYRMARRSTTECMAILDLLARIRLANENALAAKHDLHEVLAMLTRMLKAVEQRDR